jgi:D-sedoheptulose 7-phosphate isomerase
MNEQVAAAVTDHRRLVEDLGRQEDVLQQMAQAIIDAIEDGHRVYLLGNGGSAADAQHIAAELVGRFKRDRCPLPAVSLTTDSSNLLSIGNDYGFGHVFTRQVEGLVRAGDVVWALSTSGNSPNVVEAVHAARSLEACVIGFSGKTGGKLKPLCDHCLCVDHTSSDRIQEIHQIAYHVVCELIEQHFVSSPGNKR